MDHNLLCPMQLRMNEVIIDDCPKFLHLNPTDETHASKVPGADKDTSLPILEDTILEDTSVPIGAKCVRGIRLTWDIWVTLIESWGLLLGMIGIGRPL
eukprot:scaffold138839_cov37-Attheya_sp.AAC.1